jgi:glutaredoxin
MPPTVPVTVYTREGCHLCDEAVETLQSVADEAGVDLALELVDVDADESLREQYGDRVPVVTVGGDRAFEYRVEEDELRRLFEGHGSEAP